MKKTSAILAFLMLINMDVFSQNQKTFKELFEEAESYFPKEKATTAELFETTKKAIPLYLELLKREPENYNIKYKLGRSYLNSRTETEKAIPYLEEAIKSTSNNYKEGWKEKNAPEIAYVFLGDAYHLDYKFDEAIAVYEKYENLAKADLLAVPVLKEVDWKIEVCKNAKKLVASPVDFEINSLGGNINSAYADYSPVLSADEAMLIFTSRKPGSTGGKLDEEGNYFEDIYISTKTDSEWAMAANIGAPINTPDHEASIGISVDGQEILIYKDDEGDGNIYSTSLHGDKWSEPVKLNDNINSKYWEPDAFLSADGKTLYFVSNRPGGFGGRDIYKSEREAGGDWGPPVNLGRTINTPYEENAPFIHPDGITLYFSSNGHTTMGGFDIFSSTMVGSSDDVFYIVSPDKKRAYFSSFRKEGLGEKDIYVITFKQPVECPNLSLFKGSVLDTEGNPAQNVQIIITDNETGKYIRTVRTNSKTGKYLFILPPGTNYNISYEAEGYLFFSENRDVVKDPRYCEIFREVNLPALVVGAKVVLNNIFFDFDKATLRPASNVELEKVLKLLNDHPNISIEISGHTDSKGDDAYNLKLSDERAHAVVKYLTDKGIKAERMTAKGYGESQPAAANENKDGSDNPEGRQLNRRVELKIIGI